MPICNHNRFNRPPVSVKLWRYTDLSKFVDLLTSEQLWLTNAEILAEGDPYEGLPGAIRFPHRMWKAIDEVPEPLRKHILSRYGARSTDSAKDAFIKWFMEEEQSCLMREGGRRNFYVNCWHAAEYETVAMWKIYGAPGAGVAIVTNGARIEQALALSEHKVFLGSVEYIDPMGVQIGASNVFDALLAKRVSFSYEREVRLVHWDTSDLHDPLESFCWNAEKMRFEEIAENPHPIKPGISLGCELNALIERVVVSPFAPQWYLPMIERLRDRLGYQFSVFKSELFSAPPIHS